MADAPARDPAKSHEHTESLTQVPPHGLKQKITPGSSLGSGTIIAAAAVFFVIALSVWMVTMIMVWWRNRARAPIKMPSGISLSDWQKITQAIDQIQVSSVESETGGGAVSFAGEVSLLLRRALELKTGRPFAERTTEEIKQWAASGLELSPGADDSEFLGFLERLDAARFAGRSMSTSDASKILDDLRAWVRALEGDTDGVQ
jgi:hypothetical protein